MNSRLHGDDRWKRVEMTEKRGKVKGKGRKISKCVYGRVGKLFYLSIFFSGNAKIKLTFSKKQFFDIVEIRINTITKNNRERPLLFFVIF